VDHNALEATAAAEIVAQFDAYRSRFHALTRRAREHFEARDWGAASADAAERLAIYRRAVDAATGAVRARLGAHTFDPYAWALLKEAYAPHVESRPDGELAETFFNSVTRRVFSTIGVDERIEFVGPADEEAAGRDADPPIFWTFDDRPVDASLIREIVERFGWRAPFADLEADSIAAARVLREELAPLDGRPVTAEVLAVPFFRNKGAYLVGRLHLANGTLAPVVLALMHREGGMTIDAVLPTSDEVSVVFGFSWSYFQVEAARPRAVVRFLRSIMPHKRVDELYTSIGYNKHGKTELYRSLLKHMAQPDARFEVAEGEEGLVMSVFTLPSFNVVFKVIKDSFGQPKRTTRRAVMDKYHFVFVRDRVGRLADAQEFEGLEFRRACFTPELLASLLEDAASTVRVDGERVIFKHLYTERRVTPLNIYLRDSSPDAAREAVIDYGTAIKDLAAANIFTGDMLLKNFGVTRHGRVICYDYDELCLLSDCQIRSIPQSADLDDEMSAEQWFYVGENDVFPEEFSSFLVPPGALRDTFLGRHHDLLQVEYWRDIQARVAAGEMFDVFPYRDRRRLRRS